MSTARSQTGECTRCAQLVCEPAEFERALPGILILSSGQGESRGDQGLCSIHQRLVTREMTCRQFRPRATKG